MFTIHSNCIAKQHIARETVDACISRGYYASCDKAGTITATNAGDACEVVLTLEAAARYYRMRRNDTYHAAAELLNRDGIAALKAAGIDAPRLPRLGAVTVAR
jgi:hypothetical protein